MRAPFQVLVLPYRRIERGGVEYAVFKRADDGAWQFIAGGGEGAELPLATAKREALEEAGIPAATPMAPLRTINSIPVENFAAHTQWPDDLYVIPEHCFAVDVTGQTLAISNEHISVAWGAFAPTAKLLRYDGNRTALWELNQRLVRGDLNFSR